MKRVKSTLLIALFFSAATVYSCKDKAKENTDTNADNPAAATATDTTPAVAPAQISSDDILKKGVTDAVKDYPSVKAEVSDSVINLSGEIKRADWQKLNPTLNTLHPKRVNSANLTIK